MIRDSLGGSNTRFDPFYSVLLWAGYFFFTVVGRLFFASNSSLIDEGAVAFKVPKFVFGMVACGCGRFFVFCLCVFLSKR